MKKTVTIYTGNCNTPENIIRRLDKIIKNEFATRIEEFPYLRPQKYTVTVEVKKV
jgi:hypothetical protein